MMVADAAGPPTGHASVDPMLDARDRVAGRTRYVIDVDLPHLAHAALVRSTEARGRLLSIETTFAAQLPGVIGVLTAEDLCRFGLTRARFGTIDRDQPILPSGDVRHVGEPVAAVVADTPDQARRAAAAIQVEITSERPVLTEDEAARPGAPLVHSDLEDNVVAAQSFSFGDLEAAVGASARIFRHRFTSPAAQQTTLEPQVVVARWEGDSRLQVWATTQSPSRVGQELARVFGLRENAVQVSVPPLGGGFGAKNHAKLEPLVAFLALVCERPVRLVNSRAEEFVTTTKHAASVQIETGIDEEGMLTYRQANVSYSGGAYAISSRAVAKAGALVACGPYRFRATRVNSTVYYTNLPPAGSFRGLGANQVVWAAERQIDLIAAAIGVHPVEFRRRNVILSRQRLATGEAVPDAHWLECLDEAWNALDQPPAAEAVEGPVRRGRGVALSMKHTMTPGRSDATLALIPDGTIELRTSAVDMGQGSPTVLARIAARALAVPIDRVRPIHPDTGYTPFDATTSSSRTTYAMGEAVRRATAALSEELLSRAAEAWRYPPELLALRGLVIVTPDAEVPATDLLAARDPHEVAASATFLNEPTVDPSTGKPFSSSHWHQAAVAVEIHIDEATGRIEVVRASTASWAGEVLSVSGARLQDEGNTIFGIGPALFEEIAFHDGAPINASLSDYRIPSIRDIPGQLLTQQLEEPNAEPHGLGESVIPAVAPAIGNALANALGVDLFDLPLTPQRILAALLTNGRHE